MQSQDFTNKAIPVVLGASVVASDNELPGNVPRGCVTMRYDFKPVSVDYSQGSVVKTEAGEARVVHGYKQDQGAEAVFQGTTGAGAASDFVLVFDGEKFVVERLVEFVGALKHVRSADVAGHDNTVVHKRTRNPRATIVAASKKQKRKESAAAAAAAAAASEAVAAETEAAGESATSSVLHPSEGPLSSGTEQGEGAHVQPTEVTESAPHSDS